MNGDLSRFLSSFYRSPSPTIGYYYTRALDLPLLDPAMTDSSGCRRRFAIASSYFCLCISFSASFFVLLRLTTIPAELWYAARRLDSLQSYYSIPIVFSQAMGDPQENRYLDFLAAYSTINQSYSLAKSYGPARSHQSLMVLHCSGIYWGGRVVIFKF
ncbi:uncharacterized protein LOC133742892 isoform X1 [Rosa rugosa]|uniref:uncharacterized protein LOC133742892 isoform X1 n=1 Tax=Rosa rugosa TaxID=74645 RepID=UPI002B40DE3E|nr:uncharacterized protein LOC133742892 isoform X1 [Rosa rugosa]